MAKLTVAGSERSKPTIALSRTPSSLGENRTGWVAKRMTSGNSLFSCCVAKNAPIVASTRSTKTTRTRGRLMAAGP